MKNGVVGTICFIVGGVAGYFVGANLMKNAYAIKAKQEIDSVVEVFREEREKLEKEYADKQKATASNLATNKPSLSEYAKKLKELEYVPNSEPKEVKKSDEPYIIPPEEFLTEPGYEKDNLTYYSDGVVVDTLGNVLDDEEVEDCLGKDWKDHFGEYEDDSIHVRNPKLKMEYEVLKDLGKYRE